MNFLDLFINIIVKLKSSINIDSETAFDIQTLRTKKKINI
jgi:hypothetical protein